MTGTIGTTSPDVALPVERAYAIRGLTYGRSASHLRAYNNPLTPMLTTVESLVDVDVNTGRELVLSLDECANESSGRSATPSLTCQPTPIDAGYPIVIPKRGGSSAAQGRAKSASPATSSSAIPNVRDQILLTCASL